MVFKFSLYKVYLNYIFIFYYHFEDPTGGNKPDQETYMYTHPRILAASFIKIIFNLRNLGGTYLASSTLSTTSKCWTSISCSFIRVLLWYSCKWRHRDRTLRTGNWNEYQFLSIISYLSHIVLTLFEPRHDKTNKMSVCPVWSEPSLCAQWLANIQAFFMRTAKTDQTGQMPRLIWVFAGRTAILLVLSCRSSFQV